MSDGRAVRAECPSCGGTGLLCTRCNRAKGHRACDGVRGALERPVVAWCDCEVKKNDWQARACTTCDGLGEIGELR